MTEQEQQSAENQVIQKLKAQKNTVQPSRELLHSILAQLPEQQHTQRAGQSFWWLKLAIPAGVALVVGGIFFGLQTNSPEDTSVGITPPVAAHKEEAPAANTPRQPIAPEQAMNLASIEAEAKAIEGDFTFDEFFQDELQTQEIDAALAAF